MMLFWLAFTIVVFVVVVFALLLFSPVVAEVDTDSRRIEVRWSFFLTYRRPLPGVKGHGQLTIAGITITLPRRERKRAERKKEKPATEQVEARRLQQRKRTRLLWNCLLDDDIRGALMRRFRGFPADIWQAVEVRRFKCGISLSDPALSGMLWGAMTAVNWGPRVQVECNFLGRNTVQTELRLYPHRVVKALLKFFLLLPYRGIFKEWRVS